ncbi:MAG: hypothetical protein A3B99_05140 [Candidatus Yanofskybacteria bacterium RIFCSPHIGHO2_02_FULL_44_12b]|uniref:CYTH domain-containing protein n=2 Tax=Candidatus Yanofskyibacteriota TaxID=1752733 RepID=A0A1F8GJ03_9BACT|nr:MAG: hypothetical protein UW79_C0023G0023 [Candidatus Yanofskybacteria bacterium GW2011_GWA2_44_9]OGN04265.1 MAG: hypothetical protein A2659_03195 [Candidatus Yanofskybacteria bacterium RIFCSPHIGHO2_01_FULL_44_24]OGN14371.1 MAG: hypothetical protein A3B99_05140 [Candidatus Yanofskybacteria bacterium RIFCSPHIGHO2_02_FULL_44_12b]OGN25372.1 MAG: hypothetical protein A2925_00705 [Candidatus Yanofskybacteria bacterium RIFCSPLOWO2_01_FULL_44_22]
MRVNGQEIERRFLVTRLSKSFPTDGKVIKIKQAYFEAQGVDKSFRVRISETGSPSRKNLSSVITLKSGKGRIRKEKEYEIDLRLGNELMKIGNYWLAKNRHLVKHAGMTWEIDFFLEPLDGIILAEIELETPDQKVEMPPWIEEYTEVTDSLTNLHLARLASDLRDSGAHPMPFIQEHLNSSIPKIVVTGPPCSGKSTFIESVKSGRSDIHCVPEVATIIINQLGIVPGNHPISNRRFQEAIYRIQRIFEATSAQYAISAGKKAVIFDRGTVDAAAYLKGELTEFEKTFNTSRTAEYAKYDGVICLDVPPRDVYNGQKANNQARSETYEQACQLRDRMVSVWRGHPNFVFVPNGSGWEEKKRLIADALENLISRKPR